ncbi:MAG: hypothetical protein LBQ30_09650 [Treponema sp.]|jgi:hypothetical protein|nr:hypothetical protein [Treponema sp.]
MKNMRSISRSAGLGLLAVMLGVSGCGGKQDAAVSARTNKNGTQGVTLLGSSGVSGMLAPETPGSLEPAVPPARQVKVDPKYQANQGILEIKEKLFIAQTNDVYLNPEEYLGKTIKLEGIFQRQSFSDTDPPYYFVIRYGPGCCGNDGNAGFEVMWEQPDAVYPQDNDWVEAIGVLGSYEEDGYPYICINLSSLKTLETRGQEFVTQ